MTTPIPEYHGPVSTVGVIGAGSMASQFAALFALRLDVPVLMSDLDADRLDAGIAKAGAVLDRMVSKGRLTAERADQARSRISGSLDPAGFAEVDWLIEAVFEDLEVKQDVMARYEAAVGPLAILATNTSSLSVAAIGARLARPERLVGFHFFNPVAVMKLIEVVKTPTVTDDVIQVAMSTAQALGKTPVLCTDTAGFLVNRLLTRVLAESWRQVEAGVPITTVDRASAVLQVPMTPFELVEMVGPRVAGHVLRSHHEAFGDRYGFGPAVAATGELERFYDRDAEGKILGPSAELLALFPGTDDDVSVEEVGRRLAAALSDEIRRMLDDGVVASKADIDTAMALAAGYPKEGVTSVLRELHSL